MMVNGCKVRLGDLLGGIAVGLLLIIALWIGAGFGAFETGAL